jgi:hypothetical protein
MQFLAHDTERKQREPKTQHSIIKRCTPPPKQQQITTHTKKPGVKSGARVNQLGKTNTWQKINRETKNKTTNVNTDRKLKMSNIKPHQKLR